MTPLTVLLSGHAAPDESQAALEDALCKQLAKAESFRFARTASLYDLSPEHAAIHAVASLEGDVVVLSWFYARAAYWILRAGGVEGRPAGEALSKEAQPSAEDGEENENAVARSIWCVDLKSHDTAEAVLTTLEKIHEESRETPDRTPEAFAANTLASLAAPSARRRWYPVIDFDRCTDCLECLNFCLFGVFGVREDGGILIEQPDACRHGCPACSRICPAGAIMFPAHDDPAIAGDTSRPASELRLDLSQIFGVQGPATEDLAAAERDAALRAMGVSGPSEDAPLSDPSLDQWVDELDELDL